VKDWQAINKSSPEERKKIAQKTRKFLPLTDKVIEQHLLGKEIIGDYRRLSPPARREVLVSCGGLR
jgi:hypothetical protein